MAHKTLLQEAPELTPRIIGICPNHHADAQPRSALSAPVTPSALHFLLKATVQRYNRSTPPP